MSDKPLAEGTLLRVTSAKIARACLKEGGGVPVANTVADSSFMEFHVFSDTPGVFRT